MSQKDWKKFYAGNHAPTEPTAFCRWFLSLGLDGKTAVDVGCGNGRDTAALAERYVTIGIDPAGDEATARVAKATDRLDLIGNADVTYSRFWLHSVPIAEALAVLAASPRHFVAEARVVGDRPTIYDDHDRHFLDGFGFVEVATRLLGFRLDYYREGRGMARYRDEDPLVCRIVLTRKNS